MQRENEETNPAELPPPKDKKTTRPYYGESLLTKILPLWRRLQMMEKAMLELLRRRPWGL